MLKKSSSVFEESDSSDSDNAVYSRKKKVFIPPASQSQIPLEEAAGSSDDDDNDDYMNYDIDEIDENDEVIGTKGIGSFERPSAVVSEDNLTTSLFERNKDSVGLSIMKKMGFKVGETLGASNAAAIYTPITVSRMKSKAGIGLPSYEKKIDVLQEFDTSDYNSKVGQKINSRNLKNTMRKLKKLCFEISGDLERMAYCDNEERLSTVNSLWRDYAKEFIDKNTAPKSNYAKTQYSVNTDSNDKILDLTDKDLQTINNLLTYLRVSHFYCWYCGCTYLDLVDLNENCPGINEDDHVL